MVAQSGRPQANILYFACLRAHIDAINFELYLITLLTDESALYVFSPGTFNTLEVYSRQQQVYNARNFSA